MNLSPSRYQRISSLWKAHSITPVLLHKLKQFFSSVDISIIFLHNLKRFVWITPPTSCIVQYPPTQAVPEVGHVVEKFTSLTRYQILPTTQYVTIHEQRNVHRQCLSAYAWRSIANLWYKCPSCLNNGNLLALRSKDTHHLKKLDIP